MAAENDAVIEDFDDEYLYEMSDEELEAKFREAKRGLTGTVEVDDGGTADKADETVEVDDGNKEEEKENTEQSTDVDSDDNEEETVEVDGAEETSDEGQKQTEEVVVDEKEKTQVVQKHKYKANGQEFEFTDDEIKTQFGKIFGQAMDYTKKMQAIAPYRSMIATIKDENISQEDLNLAIEVLKGDKNAITSLLKRTGVNALELDTETESTYQPKNYGRDEASLKIAEIADEISRDPEYPVTYHIIDKQWDSASREAFRSNPEMIKDLHLDVKSGVFDKVSPMAMKLKILDGSRKSDIDYYVQAGRQYYDQLTAVEVAKSEAEKASKIRAELAEADKAKIAKVKADELKRQEAQKAEQKRKAAAPTPSARADKKDVIDYLEENDEDYDKWYADLQNKM